MTSFVHVWEEKLARDGNDGSEEDGRALSYVRRGVEAGIEEADNGV